MSASRPTKQQQPSADEVDCTLHAYRRRAVNALRVIQSNLDGAEASDDFKRGYALACKMAIDTLSLLE